MPLCIAAEWFCAQPILRRGASRSPANVPRQQHHEILRPRDASSPSIASHRVAAFSFNHQ
jgi:hypothetical protein